MAILFEDMYMYSNQYWKDIQSREHGRTNVTLNDIVKNTIDNLNNTEDTFLPAPGQDIVTALGDATERISHCYMLLNQLFGNQAIVYPKEVQEEMYNRLISITDSIKSLSECLDKYEKPEKKYD